MKINIQAKNLRIGTQFEDRVKQKLDKYERYFEKDTEAWVKVQSIGLDFQVEVTLKVKNHYYRAENTDKDLIKALDDTIHKLEKQISKQKTKLAKRHKDYSYLQQFLNEIPEEEEDYKIVKNKKYTIEKLSPEDAALQMELLGHSFLIFLHEKTNKVAVVYKRIDKNYGLIEPEY